MAHLGGSPPLDQLSSGSTLITNASVVDSLQLPSLPPNRQGSREMIAGRVPVIVEPLNTSEENDDAENGGQLSEIGTTFSGSGSDSDSGSETVTRDEYRGSFRLQSLDRRVQRAIQNYHQFEAPPSDAEVPVNKRIVKRSKKAVETGIKLLRSKERAPSTSDKCDVGRCCPRLKQPEKPPSLQFAQHAGLKMMPGFFFPAMPKVLADVWVGLELLVTLFDFIFTCVTFESSPVNIFVLILVIISFILALIDGFLYFIQGGSCIACFRFCQKKLSKSENSSEDNILKDDDKKVLCQFIPNKWKEHLSTWFEVLRTVLSELLLYPLAVADVIALAIEQPFGETDANSRIDFSLITIGTFYLVLSVYFMRSFMAISSLLNLRRVHKNTKSNYVTLVTKFCIHLVGQILVNAAILVMIAMKVRNERCDENDARNTANETILIPSPFLWYDMIAGDLLPFLGVILFFVVNYPTVKEFSMAFYIDMMSTIIGESFSDLVFQGEGVKHAKEKAKEVQEKANITQTKVDFEEYQKLFTLRTKVIYRLTHPAVVVSSLLYFCLMGAFIVCYILGRQNPCDSSSPIEIVLLNGDPGIDCMFFIGTFIIIIANYQAVIVVATWVAIIGIIAVIPIIAIVSTPFLLILGAIYLVCSLYKRE